MLGSPPGRGDRKDASRFDQTLPNVSTGCRRPVSENASTVVSTTLLVVFGLLRAVLKFIPITPYVKAELESSRLNIPFHYFDRPTHITTRRDNSPTTSCVVPSRVVIASLSTSNVEHPSTTPEFACVTSTVATICA